MKFNQERIELIVRMAVAGAFFKPNGMRVNSKSPVGTINAALCSACLFYSKFIPSFNFRSGLKTAQLSLCSVT